MGQDEECTCPQDPNLFRAFIKTIYKMIDDPVTQFREISRYRTGTRFAFKNLFETYLDKMVQDNPPDGNLFRAFMSSVYNTIDAPVTWFREKVVEPNQKQYPWYHHQYRRVPTIDQCYTDDVLCDFEANSQFKRDRAVESEILNILRMRYENCMMYENPDIEPCKKLWELYRDAEECWFIKYGDLGAYGDAKKAYMKQKHRMIWERRHGPLSDQTK